MPTSQVFINTSFSMYLFNVYTIPVLMGCTPGPRPFPLPSCHFLPFPSSPNCNAAAPLSNCRFPVKADRISFSFLVPKMAIFLIFRHFIFRPKKTYVLSVFLFFGLNSRVFGHKRE